MSSADRTHHDRRHPPRLSSGAFKLLSIALQKDRDKRITCNAMLQAAYELLGTLPATCRRGSAETRRMLKLEALPGNLFRFCAELLCHIEGQIDPREPVASTDSRPTRWERSEYDHPVLLALAQTVAQAAGMTRSLGPDMAAALRKIGECAPAALRRQLIENYFGNILQDYFDACEVRFNVPDLPKDAELKLRKVDARAMSVWIFEGLATDSSDSTGGPAFADVQHRVAELMTAAFHADGQLTSARRARPEVPGAEELSRPRGRKRRGDPGSRGGGGEVT